MASPWLADTRLCRVARRTGRGPRHLTPVAVLKRGNAMRGRLRLSAVAEHQVSRQQRGPQNDELRPTIAPLLVELALLLKRYRSFESHIEAEHGPDEPPPKL